MKNLIGAFLFLSSICHGQFFESNETFFESSDSQEYFEQYDNSNQGSIAFFDSSYSEYGYDYGLDGLTNPGAESDPVPVDHGWFLLVVLALFLGFFFIKKKKQVLKSLNED